MRGLIIVLILILNSYVVYGLNAELRNPIGVCYESGNVIISYLHSGGVLKIDEIEKTAIFVATNSTTKVDGYWEKDGFNYSVLSEKASTSTTRFFFHSTNKAFTKKGDYLFKIAYFSNPTDYKMNEVSIKISCPGISCNGNSDCNYDEYCSDEGKCEAVKCGYGEYVEFNRCMPICDDRNPCTEDIYSNGHCIFKKTGQCCINDGDCNDGLACTTERCINNKCVYSPIKCDSAKDRCVVAKCIEPRGCVYESDAECLGIENEKREYFITIGEPKVRQKSFFIRLGEWLDNFLRNLF
ncbi:MAG: hypothetical protein QXG86_02040 [Candidatus Woesearchaeota archaeon]